VRNVPGKLCLLCCENFRIEVEAAVAAEGWDDVRVAGYEARCGHLPVSWEELRPLVGADCADVVVVGRACLHDLAEPPAGWPDVRRWPLDECFELVACPSLVAEAVAGGAYVITPQWLARWPERLRELGFEQNGAGEFFHDFARELLLLDTGTLPEAQERLEAFSRAVGLPARRLTVGLDYLRLALARKVLEWRLADGKRQQEAAAQEQSRQRADHMAAMDFMARMALLNDEQQAIAAIKELFEMLFAPQQLHYVRCENGVAEFGPSVPEALRRQILSLPDGWAWTESGSGFMVRLAHGGECLGVVVADAFAFPEFRERYLNVALSVAGAGGLAIENARVFRRVKETEEALRKSERSLTLAQAIAHLGHWEWDVNSEAFHWSEETYRIFGYAPHGVQPSRDAFLQAVHPDDRARVEEEIRQARAGGRFDIEYRILLPTGGVRVVHGIGEVVYFGSERQPHVIGTVRTLEGAEGAEVLGVIQDITDRKQLEWKLEQEARTDVLTGCANRRAFLHQATQEFARVRRYGGELSVLMLDLDHFKSVNDRYGHRAGDASLRRLVEVCAATLRKEDLVGRLGGEEFAVLLPETGLETATEAAERLRAAVAAAAVTLDDGIPFHFTTSVGVAAMGYEDVDTEAVLSRADRALYEAKNAGRNRVVASGAVRAGAPSPA
jgi:diguanylate cyclase (GGDEF)-like protein